MTQTNLDAARAFYAHLAAGDLAAFFETLTEDVTAVSPGSRRHIPWAGTWNGKEGFGDMMTTLDEAVEIQLYETRRFVADGTDRVIVFGHERLRTRGTDRVVSSDWVHELTFRAGRLSRFAEHYDTDKLAVALAG